MLRDKNLISTNKEKNRIVVERNLSAFCNSLRILLHGIRLLTGGKEGETSVLLCNSRCHLLPGQQHPVEKRVGGSDIKLVRWVALLKPWIHGDTVSMSLERRAEM